MTLAQEDDVTTVEQDQELDVDASRQRRRHRPRRRTEAGRAHPAGSPCGPAGSLVKVHRWLSLGLMAWLVIVALTGAWLVESNQFEAWLHPGRFDASAG